MMLFERQSLLCSRYFFSGLTTLQCILNGGMHQVFVSDDTKSEANSLLETSLPMLLVVKQVGLLDLIPLNHLKSSVHLISTI